MLIRGLVVLLVALSLIGCLKNRSAATVIAKEHIDIAEARPSPSPQPAGTQVTSVEMKPGYDKVKIGDRIKVAYYKGKYTGTVWAAEIED
jgi:hypothetical protein